MEGKGGYGVNEAGGVEARGSRGAKICSQASRQHNEPVLALYKVMSSKHVGVGHVHRFILIHWWSCQLGGGDVEHANSSHDHCHTQDRTF